MVPHGRRGRYGTRGKFVEHGDSSQQDTPPAYDGRTDAGKATVPYVSPQTGDGR